MEAYTSDYTHTVGKKHVPANDVISVDAKTSRPPFDIC